MRNLRSLRRLCSGLSNSRTTMRSPFLDWQNLASDLVLATWVLWCKGLRRLRRGRGDFEDNLFNDSLCFGSSVILMSFMSSKVILFLTWSLSPRILSREKGSSWRHGLLPWHSSSPTLLSLFPWDEKVLYMLIQLGGGHNDQFMLLVARVDLYAKMYRSKLPECRILIIALVFSFLTLCSL